MYKIRDTQLDKCNLDVLSPVEVRDVCSDGVIAEQSVVIGIYKLISVILLIWPNLMFGVSIPVAVRDIHSGEVIVEQDIVRRDIVDALLPPGVITDDQLIIAMTSKKFIKSNRPILPGDITTSTVVKRNDIIILTYYANSITLKTRAIALESGAKGDIVKLRNIKSKRIVTGRVVSQDEVTVLGVS